MNRHPPIYARTRTLTGIVGPAAFDSAQLLMVRTGSVIVFGEFGHRFLTGGDVALVVPFTLSGIEAEPEATVTTVFVDREFLIDQIFWQYASSFADRLDTKAFLDAQPSDPARIVPRLDDEQVPVVEAWLDELVALSEVGAYPERFYRLQALLSAVFDTVAPTLEVTGPMGGPQGRSRCVCHPVQDEARQVAELLQERFTESWTLAQLAELVHLSRSRVGRIFREAFGKTPMGYVTMLRVEKMAEMLRATDTPIKVIAGTVGWQDASYAGRVFRRNIGYSPRQYRTLSRGL